MNENLTISTLKPPDIAFDYEELRRQGIEYIKNSASAIWTDYNIHDPGITSLEILCYALTDLSYRSHYSIPDLMRKEDDTAADIIKEFFTAAQIFPNRTLTIADYRKLLINIEGIKNAWLRPRSRTITADITNKKLVPYPPAGSTCVPVSVKGFYDVLLEFDTTIKKAEDQEKIINKVKELLQANRNLCEDFNSIKKADQQQFRLCCDIEIDPVADPATVLAAIFFQIQLHLSPLVRFYSLQEMLADKNENYTTDRIYEGPFISKGFIKDKELTASELKKEIHLSDLMQIIMHQEQVLNIPEILFNDINQKTELTNRWIIPVADGCQPVVDILHSNVIVYKNGMPIRLNKAKIKEQFNALMDEYLAQNENRRSEDWHFDTGTYREAEKYYAIRHHFPKTYGISHWGLPSDTPVERQKQALQLQAYLWLFDQALANYLSQLTSLKNLFSIEEEKQTYFTQLAGDTNDPSLLFKSYNEIKKSDGSVDMEKSLSNSRKFVSVSAEKAGSKEFYERRNLFLDHLLSRYAESFAEYVQTYLGHFANQATDKKIVDLKRAFLKNYPEYSSERALAFNYTLTDKLWETFENISGFEKRVQSLLGFEDGSRRSLVNLYSEITEETQPDNTKKFSFRIIDKKTGKVLLVSDEKFDSKEIAQQELHVAYALCKTADAIKVAEDIDHGKFRIEVKDKLNNLVAIGEKNSEQAAKDDKDRLEFLLDNTVEEGMFLIEHLLLFNKLGKDFFPICVDPTCSECSDTDPYSFRVSIIMPAYAKRFLDIEFRNYVERVMREEMPAHLLIKICWADNEKLHELEEAYRSWLEVKAGKKEDQDGIILKRLMDAMTQIKTVYPESHLQTCSEDEQRQLFLLNKNSLGTQKSS